MRRSFGVICLAATLGAATAWAQLGIGRPAPHVETPLAPTKVAFVYVASTPANSSNYEIRGYAADAAGQLTAISGSPFEEDVTDLTGNGKLLFGSNRNGIDIDSYTIASNGALSYAAATDIVRGQNCDTASTLFLDRTGTSLYNLDYDGNDCANTTYQAFAVNLSTAKATFLNEAGDTPELVSGLSFIGDNNFGYVAGCYHYLPMIAGFSRATNGALKQLSSTPALPAAPANENYCPDLTATDSSNHVAIAMQPMEGYGTTAGPYQLATYTASSTGALTTTSKSANMPAVLVGNLTAMSTAPSGSLLAVAGTSGVQIFHFNGASPLTKETGLLASVEIDALAWDHNNHLYALSRTAGKLYVFTVTPTGASEAAGSPYAVVNPSSLTVQVAP
ncbi:MAG: hypothetical protein WA414_04645 [Acidobacteriaceae bacterium]